MSKLVSTLFIAMLVLVFAGCSDSTIDPNAEPIITVYSSRDAHLLRPLFARYRQQTGTEVRIVSGASAALLEQLDDEGRSSPADIVMLVDAANLWRANDEGLLQPLESAVLTDNIPAALRAADNSWFGLSVYARTIVYATERVKPEELNRYESLADSKWHGRLCMRSSSSIFTQSLLASMINGMGADTVPPVLLGWVANLAADPCPSDTKILESLHAGVCDVGIVSSYYLGRMQLAMPMLAVAPFWPNQSDRGVHVNVSGAGIARHSKHPKLATALLEWLSTAAVQQEFAAVNFEYPANPRSKVSKAVQSWGEFKPDEAGFLALGPLQEMAVELMREAAYH